jgi:23S rRNA pseudouridine2605 synthase
MLRLNKFLADAGVGSRRKADELIAEGKVKVNGRVVTELGTRVHLSDLVTVGGEPVNAEKHLTYILLNKPKDYITTTNDEKGRKTVMDLLSGRLEERIYPIGRLDRHTTGVLLLTNDGEMAHRLMHPRYQIPRVYSVFLDKRLATQDAKRVAEGVEISVEDGEDYVSAPCELLIDPQDAKHATLAIAEGKNREVRRIFEALGYEVARLDRKSYAGLTTRGLARGEYRHLSREEVRALESAVGLENRFNTGVADTKSAHNVRGIKSSRSTKSSRSIKSSRGIKSTNAHTTPARSTSRSNTARKRR